MTNLQNLLKPIEIPGQLPPKHPAQEESLSGYWEELLVNRSIEFALEEDLGLNREDLTSLATVGKDTIVSASLVVKQGCVLAGLAILDQVFAKLDTSVTINKTNKDGDIITNIPHTVATITGSARSILAGERTALNYIQRLSGVATRTKQFVDLAKPFGIQILNTRKTTPGLRVLERYATFAAGALNHRFGLSDGILIKDNHIRLAGGIKKAVAAARSHYPDRIIEIETTTLDEARDAAEARAEIIMLDNMTPEMVAQAVQLLNGKAFIEVSGGINLNNIQKYLIAGVNGISLGCLTHSAPSIDISLEVEI